MPGEALKSHTGTAGVVRVLRVLANEERLALLQELDRGERCVGELNRVLQIAQPTLSQQLAVLRSAGAVRTRREGKRIFYAVDMRWARVVRQLMDDAASVGRIRSVQGP